MTDYYEILQVHPKASQEIIKKAYITLAKRYHPDTTNIDKKRAEEMMTKIAEAYTILSDPAKRAEYDLKYNRESAAKNNFETTSKSFDADKTREKNKKLFFLVSIMSIILFGIAQFLNEKDEAIEGKSIPQSSSKAVTQIEQNTVDKINKAYINSFPEFTVSEANMIKANEKEILYYAANVSKAHFSQDMELYFGSISKVKNGLVNGKDAVIVEYLLPDTVYHVDGNVISYWNMLMMYEDMNKLANSSDGIPVLFINYRLNKSNKTIEKVEDLFVLPSGKYQSHEYKENNVMNITRTYKNNAKNLFEFYADNGMEVDI